MQGTAQSTAMLRRTGGAALKFCPPSQLACPACMTLIVLKTFGRELRLPYSTTAQVALQICNGHHMWSPSKGIYEPALYLVPFPYLPV